MDKKDVELKKRKSLNYSIAEGSFASIMITVFDNYITPFAVALRATAPQIGLIRSLPQLLGAFVQLFVPELSDRLLVRKKILMLAAFFQALTCLLLFAAALWIRNVEFVIISVALYGFFGAIITPLWASWMGDLVPQQERGRYFGKRTAITGVITFFSIVLFGVFLEISRVFQQIPITAAFALIFAVAFIARLVSWQFFRRMYEPKYEVSPKSYFTFVDFLKRMPSNNFGRFVIFAFLMNIAVQISGPFFAVYVLQELHYNYIQYTVYTFAFAVASFVFMYYWGGHSDLYGNRMIFAITGLLTPVLPLLWLLTGNFWYIIIIQIFGGFIWAGFNLSTSNYIYDAVTPQKRARIFAYYNIMTGVGIFLGASIGGLLYQFIDKPWLFSSKFHLLFFVSAIARLLVVIIFLQRIKEVRTGVDNVRPEREMFLRLVVVEPSRTVMNGIVHGVEHKIYPTLRKELANGFRQWKIKPK
jgi:MFS family permease